MNYRVFLSLSIIIMAFLSCNNSKSNNDSANRLQQVKNFEKILRFKSNICIDKDGTGIEAFRLLSPSDWIADGGIQWLFDNPVMPAVAKFKVSSPDYKKEFEIFPNQAFFWTDNPSLLTTNPIGSKYFGCEVRQILSPSQALKNIILSRFRNNYPDLKIVQEKHLPELAEALGVGKPQPGIITTGDGAKIKIEYTKNGILTEEEIYCCVESIGFPIQSLFGNFTNTNWFVDFIFSFKAPKGKLNDFSKIFQTIAFSFKTNPHWFNKYNQVVQFLIQNQIRHIHNIGQLSRIISQTSNEISDMMMDSYNKRQAVNDRISQNFSEYVRGVETYVDPFDNNKTIELPNQYNHAWINNNGEVIMTDNPNYNPNTESNLNWQHMPKKKN